MKYRFVSTVSLTILLALASYPGPWPPGMTARSPGDALAAHRSDRHTLEPRAWRRSRRSTRHLPGDHWDLVACGDTVECEQTDRQGVPKWEASIVGRLHDVAALA